MTTNKQLHGQMQLIYYILSQNEAFSLVIKNGIIQSLSIGIKYFIVLRFSFIIHKNRIRMMDLNSITAVRRHLGCFVQQSSDRRSRSLQTAAFNL